MLYCSIMHYIYGFSLFTTLPKIAYIKYNAHHIYGFSMFNTLTKALHVIVSILQVISSFFVFNKPLEIPSYIPLFSQCYLVSSY